MNQADIDLQKAVEQYFKVKAAPITRNSMKEIEAAERIMKDALKRAKKEKPRDQELF